MTKNIDDFLEEGYENPISYRHPTLKLFHNLWDSLDSKNKKKAKQAFNTLMKKVLYEKRSSDK